MVDELSETTLQELRESILLINNSYLDWEKVQHMRLKPSAVSVREIWQAAVTERRQGFTRQLKIGNKLLQWSVSNDLEQVLNDLDINVAGGKSIIALMDKKNDHRYKIHMLVEEALSSAQLAGFNINKRAAKECLLKKKPASDTTEQVLVNLYKALQKVDGWKEEPFSEIRLKELHAILTKETIRQKGIGSYRTNNKTDLSNIEQPERLRLADAGAVRNMMEIVTFLFNEHKKPFYIHPLIKACILEYLITAIRPFKDANGRIARLTGYWYLLRQGYWAFSYIPVSSVIARLKQQYHKTYIQVQDNDGDLGYFVHFMVHSFRMAYRSLRDSLQRTNKEKETNPFVRISGLNFRQATALQWLKDDAAKIITIRELRSGFGVSKETARMDLTALAEAGWLKIYPLNKKAYAFIKGDQYDRLMYEQFT